MTLHMLRALITCALGGLLLAAPAVHACSDDGILADGFDGANSAPVFEPVADRAGLLGVAFAFNVMAHDPDPGDVVSYQLIAAPAGMQIDPNSGHVQWTPLPGQTGAHAVSVRACDRYAHSSKAGFQVTVIVPTSAPLIAPIDDQVALVGSGFQLQAALGGPVSGAPITWSLAQAPLGMQIDAASGLITWMPSVGDLGTQSVVVHAENINSQGDTAPFTLTVVQSNSAPLLAPIADQGGNPGVPFTLTAQASDADGDPLEFFLPEHPPGMGIDPATGVIRWTPATQQAGPNAVTVRVSDPLGFSDSASFTVTIDHNRAPVAVDDGPYTVERGTTLHVPAAGVLANDSDPNGDPITAVLGSGPIRGVLDLLDDGSFNYTPDNPPGTVGIQLKWAYPGRSIPERIPSIIDLDGDGIPEIIMMDGAGSQTQIYAIHGDTGSEYFKVFYNNEPLPGGAAFAVADLDLDGHPEIIVIAQEPGRTQAGKKLMAFDHTGQVKWISEPLPVLYTTAQGLAYEGNMSNASITIADIDQDGTPEILVGIATAGLGRIGYQVWDNQGNKLDYVYTNGSSTSNPSSRVDVVDLDLDGVPEIIMGSAAWTNQGELLWSNPDFNQNFATANLYPLVANLDDDPYPEMVRWARYPSPPGTLVAWNHDGSTLWTVSYPGQEHGGFGMISIADVDNDGKADIIVPPGAGATTFRVLNGADGSLKWSQTAPGSGQDTANTGWGAAVMDMDNDGYNEVVYLDDARVFHVWDGRDGSVKLEIPSGESGRSLQSSIPIFADVDGDGHAELITIGAYALGPSLIRVYESPSDDWPPMRALWNQESYHVTNINDDGTVPQFERPFWLLPGLNQNLVNQRLPEERFNMTDSFTYRASDGELQSNLATVAINILPPNAPPQILSTPRLLASPGFEYTYAVLAVDADVGETLTYALAQAPTGMSIDANHVIRWTPDAADVGEHAVVVAVTDSVGVAAYQPYTLSVTGAVTVPNVTGQAQAAAVATLEAASLAANPIEPVYSASVPVGSVVGQTPAGGSQVAAGADVRLDVSKGPQPIPVPNLIGTPRDDAEAALAAAGLIVGTIGHANDALAPLGSVISQNPAPHALQPPDEPVDLVISGGPRAVIMVNPSVILAGSAAEISVSIRDPDGSLVDPPPVVTLGIEVQPGDFIGPPPTLSGTSIQTSANGQGVFRVQASFDVGTPESFSADLVAMQPISSGPSGDVFGVFGAQLRQFSQLLGELKIAVDADDQGAIAAIDAQLGELRDAIQTDRLRGMRPVAPEGGVMPTPEIAAANGFPPGPDDAAYKGAALDVIVLLRELESAAADPGTPPSILRYLNQQLAQNVAAIGQLDVHDYGVLDSSVAMVSVVGTRLPLLTVQNIDRIRDALAGAGLVGRPGGGAAHAGGGIAGFSFGAVLSSMSIQVDMMNDLYGSFIYQLIRNAVTMAAGDLLQNFVNNTALTGLVTGSSIAIHVFELPNSVIEGYGFNTQLAEANHVLIIGPDLIEAVRDIITMDLPSAEDFKDLNDIEEKINDVIDLGGAANEAYNAANSSPDEVLRGCLFESHPACRQLVYSGGIGSVYTATGGFDLPAPVIIIVSNLGAPGGMGVYVANFVPTRE
ncbi:putative Ig domain-containing protein [Dokdonella sp.]|uniref:putative Ig domain-containing protein n=1 Tax=Dokdonella sp. TaxID=2291710 RepID=UPI0031C703A8|nr:putative Ig domain-containing protein [Dokdonella sp.]